MPGRRLGVAGSCIGIVSLADIGYPPSEFSNLLADLIPDLIDHRNDPPGHGNDPGDHGNDPPHLRNVSPSGVNLFTIIARTSFQPYFF